MKPETTLFNDTKNLKVEFPFIVTEEVVKQLIKKPEEDEVPYGLYV